MNFIKSLISQKKAQASIEYFILTAVIVSLMALSVSNFLPNLKKSLDEKFFQKAVERIIGKE